MLPWKLRRRQILPVNQNVSLVYFSPAKFQLVSCNLSLAMIWQMTYTHKLPKLCSATLSPVCNKVGLDREHGMFGIKHNIESPSLLPSLKFLSCL